MPHEIIESYEPHAHRVSRVEFEVVCKIGLIRSLLGPEPAGTTLQLEWLDDELDSMPAKEIHFPAICLTWKHEQASLSVHEEAYIGQCRDVLFEIRDLISFDDLWRVRNEILSHER